MNANPELLNYPTCWAHWRYPVSRTHFGLQSLFTWGVLYIYIYIQESTTESTVSYDINMMHHLDSYISQVQRCAMTCFPCSLTEDIQTISKISTATKWEEHGRTIYSLRKLLFGRAWNTRHTLCFSEIHGVLETWWSLWRPMNTEYHRIPMNSWTLKDPWRPMNSWWSLCRPLTDWTSVITIVHPSKILLGCHHAIYSSETLPGVQAPVEMETKGQALQAAGQMHSI